MMEEPNVPSPGFAAPQRWLMGFTVEGDLRFLSHHDTLRLFRRALARARWPVHWSEGFNPRPRMSLVLPRPVGIASDAEWLIVETEPGAPQPSLADLAEQLPRGLKFLGMRPLEHGARLQPDLVRYRIQVDAEETASFGERARRLLDSDSLPVERRVPDQKEIRRLDARPHLGSIRVQDGAVEFELRHIEGRCPRPADIAGLLGLDSKFVNHRIRRLEIQWRSK